MLFLAAASHQHVSALSTPALITFFLFTSLSRKETTIKAESQPSSCPHCVVMWCLPLLVRHLPICSILPDVLFRHFVCSVLSHEMSTPSPFPRPCGHPILSAWLVCVPLFPSPLGLDEFILFPFNQNKPWSHEITHWFKSGPGLSNPIAEDF